MSSAASVTQKLAAAYMRVAQGRDENYALWHAAVADAHRSVWNLHTGEGHSAPRVQLDVIAGRVAPPYLAEHPQAHIAYVRAWLTDYAQELWAHIQQRLEDGGNVVLEITGPTGMGKSSCAIALADTIQAIAPESLLDHLAVDLNTLPERLKGKRPGQSVILDEYLRTAGEGSRSALDAVRNLEDTIRASGVNLFYLSPTKHDHGVSQFELELILWNPSQKESRFLVWAEGQPLGYATIPWARKELWDVYQPWKQANVQRSLQGRFQSNRSYATMAKELTDDPTFKEYFLAGNKPKKTDVRRYVRRLNPGWWTVTQCDGVADFLHDVLYAWDRFEDKYERLFGSPPGQYLPDVAKMCYEE